MNHATSHLNHVNHWVFSLKNKFFSVPMCFLKHATSHLNHWVFYLKNIDWSLWFNETFYKPSKPFEPFGISLKNKSCMVPTVFLKAIHGFPEYMLLSGFLVVYTLGHIYSLLSTSWSTIDKYKRIHLIRYGHLLNWVPWWCRIKQWMFKDFIIPLTSKTIFDHFLFQISIKISIPQRCPFLSLEIRKQV